MEDDVMHEKPLVETTDHTLPNKATITEVGEVAHEPSVEASKTGRNLVSYKDIVLQLNGGDDEGDSEEEDWISIQKREEEEDDPLEEDGHFQQLNPLCPVYHFSKRQHKEDCKKWRKALIVKLLGKKLSNRFLMARLLKLWNLSGGFEVIDLDNGYTLVNFQEEKDYFHVLHEGPWIVIDHYVVIQRWKPMFNPYDEQVKRLAVWIRIPGLSMEFYTAPHLWRIGNLFGRTLKVDKKSLRKSEGGEGEYTEKAKYARICVEVDLRKSFIPSVQLMDNLFPVAYEGLHLICF